MTAFDLRPLFHSTIGFDRIADMFDGHFQSLKPSTYPPYNIIKIDEERYQIEMAVAGFEKDQITLTLHDTKLTIEADSAKREETENSSYLHRGIALRSFTKAFQLADYIVVKAVHLKNGILTVALERQVPEERKPKVIEIEDQNQTEQ